MSTTFRITGFVTALAAVFVIALFVGRGVGPIGDDPAPAPHPIHHG